jgi:hypothetical protein
MHKGSKGAFYLCVSPCHDTTIDIPDGSGHPTRFIRKLKCYDWLVQNVLPAGHVKPLSGDFSLYYLKN